MTVLGRGESGTHVSKGSAAVRVAGLNEDAWDLGVVAYFAVGPNSRAKVACQNLQSRVSRGVASRTGR
jgi:hypothetical protein